MQRALNLIFPPQCLSCDASVDASFSLCGTCWKDTPYIIGMVCDQCGAPLPGDDESAGVCDDCMATERPWQKGRAALLYRNNGRRLVLALKHGDRQDIARPAAHWMARVAKPLIRDQTLVVPVPVHRFRFLKRRFNQAALLSHELARALDLAHLPDALLRARATPVQEGLGRDARFENLENAVAENPRRAGQMGGRHILLVDDVMTSGATFAACTAACLAAGAAGVSVIALARVAKDA